MHKSTYMYIYVYIFTYMYICIHVCIFTRKIPKSFSTNGTCRPRVDDYKEREQEKTENEKIQVHIVLADRTWMTRERCCRVNIYTCIYIYIYIYVYKYLYKHIYMHIYICI